MDAPKEPHGRAPPCWITEDAELERRLRARAAAGPVRPSVWATDLVEPRKAFWSRVARPPVSPGRAESRRTGQALHRAVLRRLRPQALREVRIRALGVVGSIDQVDEGPVELKTTRHLPEAERLAVDRPDYLDQLALYLGLLNTGKGRLLLLESPGPDAITDAEVLGVEVRSTEPLRAEIAHRAEELQGARAAVDPSRLPRCRWFDRGCEYQDAHVCDCTGREPSATVELGSFLSEPRRDDAASRELLEVARGVVREPAPRVASFRDLLFPRRVYFERTEPLPTAEGGAEAPERGNLWSELLGWIDEEFPGQVERRFPDAPEPWEPSLTVMGRPTLVKTRRGRRPRDPIRPGTLNPHYLQELGLRCQALGVGQGSLVVGFEGEPDGPRRFLAVEVDFSPLSDWTEWARGRADALGSAFDQRDPSMAPACPNWMIEGCPYRAACGCGGGVAAHR